MFIQDLSNNTTSSPKQLKASVPEDNISIGLSIELQDVKNDCISMMHQCETGAKNIQLLTRVDDKLKNEVSYITSSRSLAIL